MTREEIDRLKFMVCCPLCDSEKCVRRTGKCEAEQWAKKRMKQEGEEADADSN